jgi:hypothetical protein
MGAGLALQQAAAARLREATSLAVYEAPPVQAAFPHAVVETASETDWGHKSGEGRELRLAVTLRDAGESPLRLRQLVDAAESALAEAPQTAGWQVASFAWLRSRTIREGRPPAGVEWSAVVEYRARMLADAQA